MGQVVAMDFFDLNSGFELQEAMGHINEAVVLKSQTGGNIELDDIGLVCGVLSLNDEVEIVVKFHDRLSQHTKSEFERQFRTFDIDEEDGY